MSGEAGPQAAAARALAGLQARAGRELEPGPWLEVTQAMVDAFAGLTGDDQYIHVDPHRAAGTMFGGTVAHGYLTLGLLPRLTPARDALLRELGGRMRVDYELNRVRFPRPGAGRAADQGPHLPAGGRRRWPARPPCRSPGTIRWRWRRASGRRWWLRR